MVIKIMPKTKIDIKIQGTKSQNLKLLIKEIRHNLSDKERITNEK